MSTVTKRTILLSICFLNILILTCALETFENWIHLYSSQSIKARREKLAISFNRSTLSLRSLASLSPTTQIANNSSNTLSKEIRNWEDEEAKMEEAIRPELIRRAHQYFNLRILTEPENPIHRQNYVDFLWKHFLYSKAAEQLELMVQANVCPNWATKWAKIAEFKRSVPFNEEQNISSWAYWNPEERGCLREGSEPNIDSFQDTSSETSSKVLGADDLVERYVKNFPNQHFGWNMEVELDLQIINGLSEINVDTDELWATHFKNFPESSLSMIDYSFYLLKQNRIQEAINWIQSNQSRFPDNLYMNFLADELALIQNKSHNLEILTQRYKALLKIAPNHPSI